MTNATNNCLTVNNSTCPTTSAHETRIPASLEELNQHVQGVHKATIRISPNRVTGVFHIQGRQITAGGSTFAELLDYLRSQQANHLEWIAGEQRREKAEKLLSSGDSGAQRQ